MSLFKKDKNKNKVKNLQQCWSSQSFSSVPSSSLLGYFLANRWTKKWTSTPPNPFTNQNGEILALKKLTSKGIVSVIDEHQILQTLMEMYSKSKENLDISAGDRVNFLSLQKTWMNGKVIMMKIDSKKMQHSVNKIFYTVELCHLELLRKL